jgi:uncharacterized protein YidB (DUF937 family)
MNMLGGGGNRTARTEGGLGGLLARFERAGLGNIAQSWIGNGRNHPVLSQQLQTISATIRCRPWPASPVWRLMTSWAQLSQHLPRVVDGMTPNGQMPDEGTLSV